MRLSRENDLAALGQLGRTLGGLTLLGDLTCGTVVGGHQEQVACGRHGGQTQHLHRGGRTGFLHVVAVFVEHGADTTVGGAGNDGIADVEGTGLHQHGSHGATALVKSGFDGGATGVHIRVGAQVELGVGGEQHRFEQLVDVGALLRGDVDEHGVAAVFFRNQTVFGKLAADLVRVGARLIDLVDGHHDRHMRGLGVVDGFHGLRHDAVVGGDHEDRDVGEFGATGTHCGEGFVARGIEERDLARLALKVDGHLVCADALGDAAGFAFDDVGAADGVEQSGLTVVDMAHDGDDRRTRLQIPVLLQFLFVQVDVELLQQLLVFLFGGHDLDVPADFLAEDLERGLIQGLGGRGHFTKVEQHGDQRRRIDVDLLGQIGEGRALTQTDFLSVAGRNAHAADDRSLHLLEFLTLRQTVLTRLRGLASLTSERACSAAAAAATTCRTIARSAVAALETAAIAAETIAAAGGTLAAALTRTMLAPLARLRAALTRTTTEAATLAAALTRTAATTSFAIVDARTVHRMRTRNITRSRGVHALLAAERIVARARSRGVRLRAVGVVAALRGVAMLGASSRNGRRATGLAAVSTLRTRGVAVRTIAMLAGFAWTRRAMTRLRGIGLGSGMTRLRRCGGSRLRC